MHEPPDLVCSKKATLILDGRPVLLEIGRVLAWIAASSAILIREYRGLQTKEVKVIYIPVVAAAGLARPHGLKKSKFSWIRMIRNEFVGRKTPHRRHYSPV